ALLAHFRLTAAPISIAPRAAVPLAAMTVPVPVPPPGGIGKKAPPPPPPPPPHAARVSAATAVPRNLTAVDFENEFIKNSTPVNTKLRQNIAFALLLLWRL